MKIPTNVQRCLYNEKSEFHGAHREMYCTHHHILFTCDG